jgi:hypothetical protein
MLTICFDLIVLRRFSVFRTIAIPSIFGIASSVLSAVCMYLLIVAMYSEWVSTLLWVGMLSIFPLWQYLIGVNIDAHSRPLDVPVNKD